MRFFSKINLILFCLLLVTPSLEIVSFFADAEGTEETLMGTKSIASYMTTDNKEINSNNIFPKYNSIFTKYPKVKAKINEDAGEGNIITKIEFLKGGDVVQTQVVNKQKFNSERFLQGRCLLTQGHSKDFY